MALARTIAGRSPHAIRGAKRLLNMAHDADPRALVAAETEEQVKVIGQPNMLEAVASTSAKRPAGLGDWRRWHARSARQVRPISAERGVGRAGVRTVRTC